MKPLFPSSLRSDEAANEIQLIAAKAVRDQANELDMEALSVDNAINQSPLTPPVLAPHLDSLQCSLVQARFHGTTSNAVGPWIARRCFSIDSFQLL